MQSAIRYSLSAISQRPGAVAQLGERFNGIEEVVGSNPISSTTNFRFWIFNFSEIANRKLKIENGYERE